MRSLSGLAHTTVIVRDRKRADRLTAVILLCDHPFQPLLDYFREQNFSLASEEVYARAVGLLIDFIVAIGPEHEERQQRPEFFNRFAHALKHGTVEQGHDPTGLWWIARSSQNVNQLIAAALKVSDWLVLNRGTTPLNPLRQASYAERIVFWRKWSHQSANSLLKHIKLRSSIDSETITARRYSSPAPRTPNADERPPAFPEALFPRLLQDGFVRPGNNHASQIHLRQNIRDMMVAVLMHGGGLRVSEPFHLFVPDVSIDPHDNGVAFVRIFHPTDAPVDVINFDGRPITLTREAYLRTFHAKEPLNLLSKRTGWKNNLLQRSGQFMPVYWFPSYYGRLFLTLFRMYLEHSRPNSTDPRLFLTETGMPMTAKSYSQQYYAAIGRLGIRARKADGTTPHGHRHAYGQRLEEAKKRKLVSEKTVQLCLHHRSVISQEVYTQPSPADISKSLNAATKQMFEEFPNDIDLISTLRDRL